MTPVIERCSKILANPDENLAKRFRALFTLRNIKDDDSIKAIGRVLLEDESALLKHECAYCLGQMNDKFALPYLIEAIKDEKQHPMVRHEAGEAMGAIGDHNDVIMNLLELYSKHHVRELSETCELALARLKECRKSGINLRDHRFNTIDPATARGNEFKEDLERIYLDESKSLIERYEALFTLRNMDDVETICKGFFGSPTDSALFKHEIAFVLGQLQSLESVDALTRKLADINENEIVRHECAEALGAIGKSEIIKQYLNDKSRIVRESCQVALDMADYFNDDSQFNLLDEDHDKGDEHE